MRMHNIRPDNGLQDYQRLDPKNWRVSFKKQPNTQLKLDVQNAIVYPSGIRHKISFLQEAAAFMKFMMYGLKFMMHGPQRMANLMNAPLSDVLFPFPWGLLVVLDASFCTQTVLSLRNKSNMLRWWTSGDSATTKAMSGCTTMQKTCTASKS